MPEQQHAPVGMNDLGHPLLGRARIPTKEPDIAANAGLTQIANATQSLWGGAAGDGALFLRLFWTATQTPDFHPGTRGPILALNRQRSGPPSIRARCNMPRMIDTAFAASGPWHMSTTGDKRLSKLRSRSAT